MRSTGIAIQESRQPALNPKCLRGKVAVVTGGGGGTGLIVAATLAEHGARVHVGEIREESLTAALASFPGISGTVADVGDPEDVGRLFREARSRYGAVSVLVNLVGVAGPIAAIEDILDEDFARTFRINVQGTFFAIREAVPDMKRAGAGVIVNFSSGSTRTNMPNRLPYVASKWAVEGMSRALARELGPHGIRVNAILPGMIDNVRMRRILETNAARMGTTPDALKREYLRYISTRSTVSPRELAETVVFLASPAAANITGQLLAVDGNVEWEV